MTDKLTQNTLVSCSFGASPMTLNILPQHKLTTGKLATGNISDTKPMVNIPCFGMCKPMLKPCTPAIVGTWTPGAPTVLLNGKPSITQQSVATCANGGVISVITPGQFTTQAQ